MTENKKKRGRPPGSGKKKEVVAPFNPDKLQEEFDAVFGKPKDNSLNGTLVINDAVVAAGLARATFCASAKDEAPFPSDWDKMGKVEKLKWLKKNQK